MSRHSHESRRTRRLATPERENFGWQTKLHLPKNFIPNAWVEAMESFTGRKGWTRIETYLRTNKPLHDFPYKAVQMLT